MSRFAVAIVIAAAVVAGGSLAAWALTGNELLDQCSRADNRSFCLGYIRGVVEEAVDNEEIRVQVRSMPKSICLENGITAGQLRDIAVKYLQDHPDQRHYSAASTVSLAILKAFPCDKKNK